LALAIRTMSGRASILLVLSRSGSSRAMGFLSSDVR
jgi:hypothetical protein